jgi:hypothetical protein
MRYAYALLFVTTASVGVAQETPPKIDGTKYCDAISGIFNSSTPAQQFIRDGCIKNESDFAAKLARVWAKVPAADRASCQTLLAASQPSNQGLAGCIGLVMGQHFLNGDLPDCH